MFRKILQWVGTAVGPDRVGGYVRAFSGAALTFLFTWATTKLPFLAAYLTPELNATIAVAITGFVVGLWSDVAKAEVVETVPATKAKK